MRGIVVVSLVAIAGLSACTKPSPSTDPAAVFGLPSTSSPPPLSPAPSSPIPPSPPTISPTPYSLTPSPLPTAQFSPSRYPTISPANAAELIQVAQIQFSPWDLVLAVTWSPDGQTIAVAAGEVVHLYKSEGLDEVGSLVIGVWTPGLAFSPDGQTLATANRDGRVRLWKTTNGQTLSDALTLDGHKKGSNSVDFSPDGRYLASGGDDAIVRLWDVETGEILAEVIGGTYAVPGVVFTPDGANLAIVNGDVIRLRDANTSRFVHSLRMPLEQFLEASVRGVRSFYSLAISPSGRLLASGDTDNTVYLWDVETETVLYTLAGHEGQSNSSTALVWEVEFSPDGNLLASAGGDSTVRVWDVAAGELSYTLVGHTNAVTSAVFSPDGRALATGSLDGTLRLWGVKP